MNTHPHDNRNPSPTKAGWWIRLVVAGVFAFYLNYVPIHLASTAHLDGMLESLAGRVLHHDDHHSEQHDSDGHVPHPASDHTLTLTAQSQAQGAVAFHMFILPADTFVSVLEPPSLPLPPVFERIRPRGELLPDPLQPRAPPLA